MRFLMFSLALVALAGAVLLYLVSYDTRRLEARVRAEERAVTTARAAIAVLRAERAHLARPDRIGPLARDLGLGPVTAAQVIDAQSAFGAGSSTTQTAPSATPKADTPKWR